MVKTSVKLWLRAGFLCFMIIALERAAAQSDAAPKWTPTWTDRLKKDLLKDYDPSIRPSQHYNVTTVETSITITHVEINELKSTLSVYGWMKFNWNDSRLAWNPELYENKTKLYVNHSSIWHPIEETDTVFKVTNEGAVQYTSTLQKENKCSIQWQQWPFDTQYCKMLFSPWREYEDMEIHVTLMKNGVTQGTTWNLISVSLATYRHDDENVSLSQRGTHLKFTMKRNSAIYRSTIMAPACVLIVMNLIGFWLPPDFSEKLTLNAINVLVTCMFLIHFNEYLSFYTNSTPTIVLFYSHCLYLSGLSVLINVFVEGMLRRGSKVPVYPSIKKLITHDAIASMISPNKHKSKTNEKMCASLEDTDAQESVSYMEEEQSPDPRSCDTYQDWLQFGALLERVAFIIYVIIFLLMSFFYL